MKIRNLITLITLAIGLALGGGLAAQEEQRSPPGEHQSPGVEVTDQQLKKFADAQSAIVEIQQDFSARLQEVDDPEQAHQLQVEANQEMTSAVEEAGLTVESYNEIAIAIQNDPELQNRLAQMIE